MRNIKGVSRFFTLTRSKSSNYFLSTKRDYSYLWYSRCMPVRNTECCTASFMKDKIYSQEISTSDVLLKSSFSTTSLCHSKSKDRGKEKKKPKATKLDLKALGEVFDVDDLTAQMNQAIENMKSDFIKNLTVRSTTGSFEQIPVKIDDKDYQLQELAQIARKPKLIVLNMSAFPTAIPHVLKAIEKSGLNINPQQDGTTLFCPIPKVTREHRENLSRNAKAIFIRHRDAIKDIRNKAVKTLKKRNDISEDTIRRVQGQIEVVCEKYLKEAEMILDTKQNELLGSSE